MRPIEKKFEFEVSEQEFLVNYSNGVSERTENGGDLAVEKSIFFQRTMWN